MPAAVRHGLFRNELEAGAKIVYLAAKREGNGHAQL
jgi:hypothetical protein